MIEVDQNIKLSTFCNRPQINVPIFNFITETLCTFILLLGLLLLDDRFAIEPYQEISMFYHKGIEAVIISLYFVTCFICLGGPTGFSCNPCRDLGPRIAHYILPISGKGSSEFSYSLVINAAAFVGASLAAGSFKLFEQFPIR
jgi:glycerol uptake facilitator protein